MRLIRNFCHILKSTRSVRCSWRHCTICHCWRCIMVYCQQYVQTHVWWWHHLTDTVSKWKLRARIIYYWNLLNQTSTPFSPFILILVCLEWTQKKCWCRFSAEAQRALKWNFTSSALTLSKSKVKFISEKNSGDALFLSLWLFKCSCLLTKFILLNVAVRHTVWSSQIIWMQCFYWQHSLTFYNY